MDNHLRQNLAQILSSINAPVEKLSKDTYVINGVIAKRQDHGWLLVTKNKERFNVYHSKVAVILPWLLTRTNTHSWLLKQRILRLDTEYAWALFDSENQERILGNLLKKKDREGMIIMATKREKTRQRVKSLNQQISRALSDVKINK